MKYYQYLKKECKCANRKVNKNACSCPTIRQDLLEKYILKTIYNQLIKPETKNFIIKRLLAIQEKNKEQTASMKVLLKQQKDLDNSINNLLKVIEQGLSTKITTNRLQELEKQKDELEIAIQKEASHQPIFLTEKEISDFFEKGIKLQSFALINYFVKKIVVYDNEIQIYFYSPIEKGPDGSQDFLFYTRDLNYNKLSHAGEISDKIFKIKFAI